MTQFSDGSNVDPWATCLTAVQLVFLCSRDSPRSASSWMISGTASPRASSESAIDCRPRRRWPRGCSVSRSVIREVLRASAALGLTVTRTGKGTFVVGRQAGDLVFGGYSSADLLEVHPHVEVTAAGLAAVRRTEEDLEQLQALSEGMEAETDPSGLDRSGRDLPRDGRRVLEESGVRPGDPVDPDRLVRAVGDAERALPAAHGRNPTPNTGASPPPSPAARRWKPRTPCDSISTRSTTPWSTPCPICRLPDRGVSTQRLPPATPNVVSPSGLWSAASTTPARPPRPGARRARCRLAPPRRAIPTNRGTVTQVDTQSSYSNSTTPTSTPNRSATSRPSAAATSR